MGYVPFFKIFSLKANDNTVKDINTHMGQKWSEVALNNKTLNSIFAKIDNGDGIVQKEELILLDQLLIHSKMNKDEVIEEEKLNQLAKNLEDGTIKIDDIKKQMADESVQKGN